MNNICWLESDNNIISTRKDYFELKNTSITTFHVNKEFEEIDWTKEPSKSLKQLYKERAEQLRSLYDYIIIYFSGGSDSITVLNAFLDNNIPVDEIVINYISKINEPILNGEYAKNYLKTKSYSGVITLNDITLDTINTINKKQLWRQVDNFTGLLHNFLRFNIDFYEKNNFLEIKKRGTNIGHIYGLEYPSIAKVNNIFYCIISLSKYLLTSYSNGNIPFFTSPSFPELHIKQSHILARYIHQTGLSSERDCKISIRDEFNAVMFMDKTGGDLKKQVNASAENSLILSKFMSDVTFRDIYANSIYKELIKSRLNATFYYYKNYKLFEV